MLCVARRTLWSRLSSLLPVAVAALAGCADGAVAPPPQPHALSLDRARSAALPLAERQRRQFAYVPRESIHAGPQINGPYVNTAQYYGSDAVGYGVSPAGLKRVPRGHGLTLTYLETMHVGIEPIRKAPSPPPPATRTLSVVGRRPFRCTTSPLPGRLAPRKPSATPAKSRSNVDSTENESLVAVMNISGPTISIYAGHSLSPTSTLTDASADQGIGIALDHDRNCFGSFNAGGPGVIVEFPRCHNVAPTTIVTGLQFAGGLAFNKAGDLFYIDQFAGTVNRCHRLSSCTVLASGFVDPLFMHFDADWKHMWLADEGASEIYALNPDTGQRRFRDARRRRCGRSAVRHRSRAGLELLTDSTTDAPARDFAALLRQYRAEAGLSQEALAERAGISPDAVGVLERGLRKAPYRHTIDRLARALGVGEEGRLALETAAHRSGGTPPSSVAPKHNLPREVTSFLARDEVVAEIADLVTIAPLVTIVGIGGAGKTRTATHIGNKLVDRWPDGVWIVSAGIGRRIPPASTPPSRRRSACRNCVAARCGKPSSRTFATNNSCWSSTTANT